MSAAIASAKSERPPPPALPEPKRLDLDGKCSIEYIDVKPKLAPMEGLPTIALVHGSPGTYKDFRHLVPLLQANARVVELNLPGFGGSIVLDEEKYYEHVSALGAATLVYDAPVQICKGDENVFLVGHSFGGHAAINLAAFAAKDGQLKIPVISWTAKVVTQFAYTKIVGFPSNASMSHYVSALIRNYYTDYDLINTQIKDLASFLPVLSRGLKTTPSSSRRSR
uniref:AB hydrolase-1 domain-containing protein n=1 Tax=Globisporangium ultimum (strain ATCC 200006 / CBS 805.95 / DAOM BR144) TaxID=431595 RepID=K3X743_GLOUD